VHHRADAITRGTRIPKTWGSRLFSVLVVLITAALIVLAMAVLHRPRTAPSTPSRQQGQDVAL